MERQLPRKRAVLHQQHPAARRRHASRWLPRRPDAPGHHLCRNLRHPQAREGDAVGRRCARGADLRALGQGARSEILVADQGQAGLLRGPSGGRERRQRKARRMVRGASGRSPHRRRQGGRSRRRARGGAQGARAHPPQIGARRQFPRRQAQGLLGEGPGQVRAVPRRGRQRRRLRDPGPRPLQPGGAAAARQDPQCRARPLRPHARLRADRQSGDGAGHLDRPRRVQHRQAALPQDHHHDRRRCRRRPHQNAAPHLLLPADARAHRSRPHLHRPAAAL